MTFSTALISGGEFMKASKLLCIMTSCVLFSAMSSCGQKNNDTSDSQSTVSKKAAMYSAYAAVPEDKFYIPLYAQADTASGGVAPVYLNDTLEVLGEKGDWCEVRCNGYTGYIQKEYISSEALPEVVRTTKAKTAPVTTQSTTSAVTTKADKASSTTAKDEEKDKDKASETTEASSAESTDAPAETEAPSETEATPAPTEHLPASAYPDVTISLNIDSASSDSDKYDITLIMDGRYTNYKYELHRVFADGTDKVIASGESGDTNLKLATIDSLTQTQTIDRLVLTAYFNGVAGNQVTLELKEPLA